MPGASDWVVETDGLPPANSSIADRYDTFGEPIMCCEVKSPPMGGTVGMNVSSIAFWVIILALTAWLMMWRKK